MMMPESAARTFLQITDVRPERLQEITEDDCLKEGILLKAAVVEGNLVSEPTYRDAYAMLWDSINPNMPWPSNPFVFRYEFKLIPAPQVK